jgi:hypothetical protein
MCYDAYENLTWNAVLNNHETLAKTESFEYWLHENYGDYNIDRKDVIDGTLESDDFTVEELISDFRDSDDFYSMEDAYVPIYNYVHILQSRPSTADVLLVDKYVGNVSIIEIFDVDTYAIALTGCGMDLSDNIELAYYVIDGVSPVKASQIMSLGREAKELLLHCRKYAKEFGRVSPMEISDFLKKRRASEKKEPVGKEKI